MSFLAEKCDSSRRQPRGAVFCPRPCGRQNKPDFLPDPIEQQEEKWEQEKRINGAKAELYLFTNKRKSFLYIWPSDEHHVRNNKQDLKHGNLIFEFFTCKFLWLRNITDLQHSHSVLNAQQCMAVPLPGTFVVFQRSMIVVQIANTVWSPLPLCHQSPPRRSSSLNKPQTSIALRVADKNRRDRQVYQRKRNPDSVFLAWLKHLMFSMKSWLHRRVRHCPTIPDAPLAARQCCAGNQPSTWRLFKLSRTLFFQELQAFLSDIFKQATPCLCSRSNTKTIEWLSFATTELVSENLRRVESLHRFWPASTHKTTLCKSILTCEHSQVVQEIGPLEGPGPGWFSQPGLKWKQSGQQLNIWTTSLWMQSPIGQVLLSVFITQPDQYQRYLRLDLRVWGTSDTVYTVKKNAVVPLTWRVLNPCTYPQNSKNVSWTFQRKTGQQTFSNCADDCYLQRAATRWLVILTRVAVQDKVANKKGQLNGNLKQALDIRQNTNFLWHFLTTSNEKGLQAINKHRDAFSFQRGQRNLIFHMPSGP